MSETFAPVLAILAMASVTYAIRAGGFWLMRRVPLTPRVRRGLEALPGAVIVATVLPLTVQSGLPAAIAIATVLGIKLATGREFVSLVAAVAAAALARAFGL
jgi:uncharacterized membrane protein